MTQQTKIPESSLHALKTACRNHAARWARGLKVLLILALLLTAASSAQQPGLAIPALAPIQIDPSMPSVRNHDPRLANPLDLEREARRIRQLNILRQKSIVDDAARLLRLARELNVALSAPQSTMPPAERLRRAEEIQKLAKSVKEKMRYAGAVNDDPMPDLAHWRY